MMLSAQNATVTFNDEVLPEVVGYEIAAAPTWVTGSRWDRGTVTLQAIGLSEPMELLSTLTRRLYQRPILTIAHGSTQLFSAMCYVRGVRITARTNDICRYTVTFQIGPAV